MGPNTLDLQYRFSGSVFKVLCGRHTPQLSCLIFELKRSCVLEPPLSSTFAPPPPPPTTPPSLLRCALADFGGKTRYCHACLWATTREPAARLALTAIRPLLSYGSHTRPARRRLLQALRPHPCQRSPQHRRLLLRHWQVKRQWYSLRASAAVTSRRFDAVDDAFLLAERARHSPPPPPLARPHVPAARHRLFTLHCDATWRLPALRAREPELTLPPPSFPLCIIVTLTCRQRYERRRRLQRTIPRAALPGRGRRRAAAGHVICSFPALCSPLTGRRRSAAPTQRRRTCAASAPATSCCGLCTLPAPRVRG
jgi:hypothetical protein